MFGKKCEKRGSGIIKLSENLMYLLVRKGKLSVSQLEILKKEKKIEWHRGDKQKLMTFS